MVTVLRSLWDEPRATEPPERVWRDWVLVGLVIVTALLEATLRAEVTWRPVATVVAVGLAPLLLWRRTHPLVCVVVAFGATVLLSLASLVAGGPVVGLNSMLYVLVFPYALVRWGSGREIVIGLAVVTVAAGLSVATDETEPAELFGGLGVLVAAAAGGAAFRYRAESARRAHDQIRNQERVGLARELHDTVAHHLSAITVQAQAGQAVARQRPDAALEALAVIEAEASRTLAEMRAMVAVLREGAPAQYAPQPGVADLAVLARRGPPPVIDVELTGAVARLRPPLDAAVYRIAQEALTNALRHARHTSRVQIRVTRKAGRVWLRVTDDGQVDPARPVTYGFGLMGMAERAELLGGTLRAGPAPEGGWLVEADLPTEPPR